MLKAGLRHFSQYLAALVNAILFFVVVAFEWHSEIKFSILAKYMPWQLCELHKWINENPRMVNDMKQNYFPNSMVKNILHC